MHVLSSRNFPVSFNGRRCCDFILQRSKLSFRERQLFILLFILWLALWVNILEYCSVGGLGFFLWLRAEVPHVESWNGAPNDPPVSQPASSLSAAVRTPSCGCEERPGSSYLSPSCIRLHHPWPFELGPTPVLVSWLITDLPILCISFILWKGSWWYVYPRLHMSYICSFLSWTDSLRFTSGVSFT